MSIPDKYELIRGLGSGGMGEVFRARLRGAAGFEKHIVVKRLHPHLGANEDNIKLFIQEARLVGQMNHPNVVQVFDAGHTEGDWWLVMEFVDGPNLFTLLSACKKRQTPLPLGVACRIMAGVCAGLAYAHGLTAEDGASLGVVHRDLSPDNILIDQLGNSKVTDFGIAKVRNSQVTTSPGMSRGKLKYMAPEQLAGVGDVTPRADIFVAGIVLYELITGTHPFLTADDQFSAVNASLGHYPPMRTLRGDVPDELEALVSRALAADPADRFPSSKAMKVALEHFLRSTDNSNPEDVAEFVSSLRLIELELADHSDRTLPLPSPAAAPKVRTGWTLAGVSAVVIATAAWLAIRLGTGGESADTISPIAHPAAVNIDSGASTVAPVESPDAGREPTVEPVVPTSQVDASVPEPREPRPRFGLVEFRVQPPAEVHVDGKGYGLTPIERVKLKTGRHRLRFKKDGAWLGPETTFEVRAGPQVIERKLK